MAILFGGHEHEHCDCPRMDGCPCPEHGRRAAHTLEFLHHDEECEDKREVQCRTNETLGDLYCGILETRIGPLYGKRHRAEVEFCFDTGAHDIEHAFLLCRYTVASTIASADGVRKT